MYLYILALVLFMLVFIPVTQFRHLIRRPLIAREKGGSNGEECMHIFEHLEEQLLSGI